MTKCGRCGKELHPKDAETCWYCLADLCVECWDVYGHCGHTRADEWNKRMREWNEGGAGAAGTIEP